MGLRWVLRALCCCFQHFLGPRDPDLGHGAYIVSDYFHQALTPALKQAFLLIAKLGKRKIQENKNLTNMVSPYSLSGKLSHFSHIRTHLCVHVYVHVHVRWDRVSLTVYLWVALNSEDPLAFASQVLRCKACVRTDITFKASLAMHVCEFLLLWRDSMIMVLLKKKTLNWGLLRMSEG